MWLEEASYTRGALLSQRLHEQGGRRAQCEVVKYRNIAPLPGALHGKSPIHRITLRRNKAIVRVSTDGLNCHPGTRRGIGMFITSD